MKKKKSKKNIRSKSLPKVRLRTRSEQETLKDLENIEEPKRFRRKSELVILDNEKKKEHIHSRSLPKKRVDRAGSICETSLDQSLYYKWLSANPSITMEDVLSNLDKEWNHKFLSKNPNISMENAIIHPEFDWDFEALRRKETLKELS